jgi:hypothetical protein
MQKMIDKWWVLAGAIGVVIFFYGYQNMYFHQDDLDWFLIANRSLREVLAYPIGDHVNYLWRMWLKIQWELFGFNFVPYLVISVIMHMGVVTLLYLIAKVSSGRRDLAAWAALLFSVNTNWTEIVLWTSGQTILITALFVLLAILGIWRGRGEAILLFLASWTSALALGLLGATIVEYPRLRWKVIGLLLIVGLLYRSQGGDGTSIPFSLAWAAQVGIVALGMVVNTAIGRLLIPFDRFEIVRIVLVGWLMAYGAWKWRDKMRGVWHDKWSRFLLVQIAFYCLIVAAGRAQYGIGIMRAERYGYIGLALVLLILARVLRKVKLGRWVWVVPVIVTMQMAGLYVRARVYVERPQALRTLVGQLRQIDEAKVGMEAYLPRFVFNDDRLKYSDLLPLLKH